MLLYSYEEDIRQISSWSTIHNNFLVSFAGITFKLEKVSNMPVFAIRCNRRQETVSTTKNNLQITNRVDHYLEFN